MKKENENGCENMCGIVGFVNTKDQKAEIIEQMMDRIIHRGPNSSGKFIDDQVALGFRRLSIIDLEGGTQPIYNEDGTKVIISIVKRRIDPSWTCLYDSCRY